MHVSSLFLDLSPLLQFIFTALILAIGFLYLLNATASSYFVVDAEFDGEEPADEFRAPLQQNQMLACGGRGDTCFICDGPASKQCSGCKAIRYCSPTCQSKHWKADHKLECKELRLLRNIGSIKSDSSNCERRKASGWADIFSSTASPVPGRGTCNVLQQPKKVLFPYDEFVKLFNWDNPGCPWFPPCGLLNCGNRNDWCFLCELQCHVHKVSQSLHPFSPINILSRLPNIGGNLGYGKQEDAHEFMRFAIDTMQSVCLDEFGGEKVLDLSTQETTLIQHIFGGHLQSQVICTKCNKISHRYENMMDLTVEIQGDAASLEDCLDQFTVKEWLDGENMYKCDRCCDYVKAWKRLTIYQAPNILTIALKRFQSGRFGKLNKRVTFPETLDLGPYMSEAGDGADVYKLYAVVVHVDMLNASYFGHYICYTKDFSGNWYRIDDCKVMKVEVEEVLSQGAYMLLYSRISARQPGDKPKPLEAEWEEEKESAEVAEEAFQASVESVESSDFAQPVNPVSASCCFSSDTELQSTDSDTELQSTGPAEIVPVNIREEPEDMDFSNAIKVISEPVREARNDIGLGYSPSCSGSVDLELGNWNHCSHASSAELMHLVSADSASSSELSPSIGPTAECREPNTRSMANRSSEDENVIRINWDGGFLLPESSSNDCIINQKSEASSDDSPDALTSFPNSPDEANLSSFTSSDGAAMICDPSFSRTAITISQKVFQAAENAALEVSTLCGDTSVSGRKKSMEKGGKTQLETVEYGHSCMVERSSNGFAEVAEVGCSCTVDSKCKCSGVSENVSAHQNHSNGSDDHDSLEMMMCGNHEKRFLSEVEAPDRETPIDGPQYPDCNGCAEPTFSDKKGSKVYSCDVGLETLGGDGNDLSLSSKKPLNVDEKAEEHAKAVHPMKVETNCNGWVGPLIADQNGSGVYKHDTTSTPICENGKGVTLDHGKPLISPGFLNNPPRKKSHKNSEAVRKNPGGAVCDSFNLTNSSNANGSMICNHDLGPTTSQESDRDGYINCKRQRHEHGCF
ncbi:ubiquitin carboxyl-terminal hydrolase 18-like isoform X2 [Magnolia sinica]|uniref:ubiquitin carboxyl-terminal hydrolase 18-like isoform X2 n=1 Tax=Magnolia sinica TaxID=86752 RepID=UPI002659ADBC|nr:ubiquitin carboxyl-terminal hydrolase 18-like isoform X2 [Magnolia sinica]